MIICHICGHSNSPDFNHCEKCGARLPKLDPRAAHSAGQSRQTVKYERLRTAVMKLKTGEQSWIDFQDWFQGFYEDIMGRITGLVDSIHQSHGPGWNYYEEFTEEVEATFSGVEDYETSLNQMWQAIETSDLVLAQAAVKLFLRGAEKLNDALVLNGETQRKLEENWGYM